MVCRLDGVGIGVFIPPRVISLGWEIDPRFRISLRVRERLKAVSTGTPRELYGQQFLERAIAQGGVLMICRAHSGVFSFTDWRPVRYARTSIARDYAAMVSPSRVSSTDSSGMSSGTTVCTYPGQMPSR